jgi:hydroxylysine kinase
MLHRNSDQDSVLTTPAPRLSHEEVSDIAARLFGLSGELAPLESERDQNFRITSAANKTYALKIVNRSENPAVVEMQAEALQHIANVDPNLPVPEVVFSLNGSAVEQVHSSAGVKHCVRVLDYIAGVNPRDDPLAWDLLHPMGELLAQLDLALRGFLHDAADSALLWDLQHASQLRAYLRYVDDDGHRALADHFLDRFDGLVMPNLKGLRVQAVHNDFVPDNILVDERKSHRIVGIIDFGDMTRAPLINDLACTIASAIREQPDVMAAAVEIGAGYQSKIPLETQELELLYDFIGTRLTALAVIACWRVDLHPENRSYIHDGVERTWATLERWRGLDRAEVRAHFSSVHPIEPAASLKRAE